MEIKQKIESILKKYPITFGYLFGSQAKQYSGPLSDLDLAVFFDTATTPQERKELRFKIEEAISKALKCSVDVIPLNDAQPLLEKEVVYEGNLIYSQNEAQRTHYEAQAISRWLDWKYHQNKLNQAIINKMGKPIKA